MLYTCPCGAELDAPSAPVYCSSCGRAKTFSPHLRTQGFPHSFRSPVLSAAALRERGRGLSRLPGVWSLISDRWGRPALTTLYGATGAGKSTLAMHLADDWPGRSIYLSLEEGLGATLAARAARLEVMRPAFAYPSTWEELTGQVADYDLVVIDSLQMLKASAAPGTIRAELVDRAGKSVLVTSQVNADGLVAGGKAMGHFADVIVHTLEYGRCRVDKNRYGEAGREFSWLEE